MDWKTFWTTLAIGIALVVAQGIASHFDNRFSQRELDAAGITNSWSFLQHGGMWADVFIISPIVAYALSKYQLDLHTLWGIGTAILSALFVLAALEFYRRMGIVMGDHCTHDGKTVLAGWIHGLFFFSAIWVCLEIYLGLTTPVVSKQDILIFSTLLTPFFYLGVKKFSDAWVFSTQDKWQVAALTLGVWVIAAIRLIRV